MQAIKIGEHKIKITVTGAEMERHGIIGADEKRDSAIVRRGVWSLLEEVKIETGFDPGQEKILVQFYPMRDDGCEIFVTKLGVLSESSARLVCSSNRIAIMEKRRSAYLLLAPFDVVCKHSNIAILNENAKYSVQKYDKTAENCEKREKEKEENIKETFCELYLGDRGEEYIIIEELGRESPDRENLSLLEFAIKLPEKTAVYIEEHFKRVRTLSDQYSE